MEKELAEAVKTGTREQAANAYIVRGDALVAANKRVDALVEGYLKVIIMFDDIRSTRLEALDKAIGVMESLGDPRAERLRKIKERES